MKNGLSHAGGAGQGGAALAVGLIMLLVLTLLGVSNMNMTTIELKMAANTQNQNHCFQVAEAGIGRAVAAVDPADAFAINFSDQDQTPQVLGTVSNAAHGASSAVTASFENQVAGASCPGSSITKFSCIHFEIQSAGSHPASSANCQHIQGVFRVAPAPQS